MLNNKEEIVLEQYITNVGMSKIERDFYTNLILHTKEIDDSIIENGNSKYKIGCLNFNRIANRVKYNGSASNGKEIKLLDGVIYRLGNQYIIVDNIYRMYEYLKDYDRSLTSIDKFLFKKDKVIRSTHYSITDNYFEREFDTLNDNYLSDCYNDMIYPNQKKLINTKKDTNE